VQFRVEAIAHFCFPLFSNLSRLNVVIVVPPAGETHHTHAAIRVTRMMRTFRSIKFVLSVGVGSGAPTVPNTGDLALDIRLGDVVVGCSDGHNGKVSSAKTFHQS
jgi:hypothetical protein